MTDSKKKESSSFVRRARNILDATASLAALLGLGILAFQMLVPRVPVGPHGGRDLSIPAQPLSLEGAALIGQRSAQVVMLEFSDFECSYCGKFSTEILPSLEKQYIRNGQLLLAFRHLPIRSHQNAEPAAVAASCAADQHKFAPLHDLLFANQRALDAKSLTKHTAALGLDQMAFDTCLKTIGPERVKADAGLARRLGVTGTPTFFIGRMGPDHHFLVRKTIKGSRPISEFVAAIDEALSTK